MNQVKLSSKNQIVFPKEARQALRLKSGDQLLVTVIGNVAIVTPKPKKFSQALKGRGKDLYPPDYLEKERASWS